MTEHSTGPRTEQGKAAVAQNRTTHGLAGRHIVLPGEDAARRTWFKALAQLNSLQAPRRAEDADRLADERLCAFIEHYINGPMPNAGLAAPQPKNEDYNSKPILPPVSPARRAFMDAAGIMMDRNLAARMGLGPQQESTPVWARSPRVTDHP